MSKIKFLLLVLALVCGSLSSANAVQITFKHAFSECSGLYAVIDVTIDAHGHYHGEIVSIGSYNDCPDGGNRSEIDGDKKKRKLVPFSNQDEMRPADLAKLLELIENSATNERAIIEAANNLSNNVKLSVIPNPATKGSINVQFKIAPETLKEEDAKTGKLRVFNSTGVLVADKSISLSTEIHETLILSSDAPSGQYFVTFDINGKGLGSCKVILE